MLYGENGIFTKRVIDTLAEMADAGSLVFVDSRHHIQDFHHVIVKCNHLELLRASNYQGNLEDEDGVPEDVIEQALQTYSRKTNLPVFISCGARGMKVNLPEYIPPSTVNFQSKEKKNILTVPPFHIEGEVDICGAGDSALTGIACAAAAGADMPAAALVGNLVASVIVQQIGVTGTCTREQLLERFDAYKERLEHP
ncbi:MAG: hypothetical protein HFH53_03285 [Hespellia sp.]|nr:hypothetical protein [Hespellia sp.]